MIKETQRAKITCPASHFMNLWHFGQPSWNCRTTPINFWLLQWPVMEVWPPPVTNFSTGHLKEAERVLITNYRLLTPAREEGKPFLFFSLQKGHMMRDRHRSRRNREGRILNCSNTLSLIRWLWSRFLRHGNRMTWKIKLGGFQKQSAGFVALSPPHIFSAD